MSIISVPPNITSKELSIVIHDIDVILKFPSFVTTMLFNGLKDAVIDVVVFIESFITFCAKDI